jgi:hypothetical protein
MKLSKLKATDKKAEKPFYKDDRLEIIFQRDGKDRITGIKVTKDGKTKIFDGKPLKAFKNVERFFEQK